MDIFSTPRPRLWKSKTDFFRPFRTAASAELQGSSSSNETTIPLYDPTEISRASDVEDGDLGDLNKALAALVELFPDVQPEVFREMLVSVSAESALQIVAEQLLTKKGKFVRGRWRTPEALAAGKGRRKTKLSAASRGAASEGVRKGELEVEQTFRGDAYKKAVKGVLYQEFRSLSHSSIRAVLAEQNFSYTMARPVLQQISARSWRFSFAAIWSKRSPAAAAGEHPFIVWQAGTPGGDGQTVPAVKRTGSPQLDHELYELFVAPVLENQRQTLLVGDYSYASKLNEAEAEEMGALFDCECCYGSVPFEQLATCDDDCHQLCFDCVRRTVSEALFGQGWARAVDLERSTLRCFAPTSHDCQGAIPASILRRALANGVENEDTWNEFQERAAGEALAKSRLPLQRCPFCTYVEVAETPAPRRRHSIEIWRHVTTQTSPRFQLLLLSITAALFVFTIPLLLLASLLWLATHILPSFASLLTTSWNRVYTARRGLKFHCRNPHCSKTSCTRCLSPWLDPHACFENEKTSLRTAIESSATAAVKRTCPKCLLSFVKSSGCNKLVCNCGYTMCYICRQEITSKEGYAHFCQHFRPHGGRCMECERCDLYGEEDEEVAIRKAAEAAEKAWKEREGGREVDERATRVMVEALVGREKGLRFWEVGLDAVVDAVVA